MSCLALHGTVQAAVPKVGMLPCARSPPIRRYFSLFKGSDDNSK